MAKSDIFVLSTFHEGVGMVLPEAMDRGCPTISSDCDFGPREILKDGECGILVPVGDSQVLSEKIVTLLSDKGLRETLIKKVGKG